MINEQIEIRYLLQGHFDKATGVTGSETFFLWDSLSLTTWLPFKFQCLPNGHYSKKDACIWELRVSNN